VATNPPERVRGCYAAPPHEAGDTAPGRATDDPDRAEARKRNASKAGKRGGKGRGFRTTGEIPQVKEAILELVDGVLTGEVERSSAAVVGNLYNTLLHALEVERRIKETEDLERRMAILEERQDGGARKWG